MYKQGIKAGLDKNNAIVFSDDCNRYRMGGQQFELGVTEVTAPTSPYGPGPWQSWSSIPKDQQRCPCKTCNCCGPNYVCYFHDVYNNCDK